MKTCVHLEPLETELALRGVALGEGGESPYSDSGVWFPVNCIFDGAALRTRLNLPDFITYEEYDGRVAGSDATWYCQKCSKAIMGMHPRYAKDSTPRVK
jgi:hypothetical protein